MHSAKLHIVYMKGDEDLLHILLQGSPGRKSCISSTPISRQPCRRTATVTQKPR